MDDKLFVIGNGFDLHHKIPSSYWQFGEYISREDDGIYEAMKEYLSFDENFWNYFEERLASFDSDAVIDHAQNYLESYSSENWSDAYHHNYEYEIQQITSCLSDQLQTHFAKWIRQLQIPIPPPSLKIRCIDPTAKFINFNYTPTLQQMYGVSERNILHIHGDSTQEDSELILGHGWEPNGNEVLSLQITEDTDTRVAGGYELIDRYFSDTFKPAARIIEQNSDFFHGLGTVNQVFVLGHSLADADEPYISEIITNLKGDASWIISFHNSIENIKENFSGFGVSHEKVSYVELKTL